MLETPLGHATRVAGPARGDPVATTRWTSRGEIVMHRHQRRPLPGPPGPGIPAPFARGIYGRQARPPTTCRLKIRRFSEGLFNHYDGLVHPAPGMLPGPRNLRFAEIAAFPDGKHDDQVDDVLSGGSPTRPARRGLKLGRVVLRPAKVRSSRPNRAIRSSTTGDNGSGLARSQESDVHQKILARVGCVAAAPTSIHLIARRPPRRRRTEPEQSNRSAFFSTVELVNALEQEKLQGKPTGQIAARLTHSDLVILDELGVSARLAPLEGPCSSIC